MLVLSRKLNESIVINDNIEVVVLDIVQDQIKLGIKAPREIAILRKEIYEEVQQANLAAASASTRAAAAEELLKKKD
jgi:carbon storage regulator